MIFKYGCLKQVCSSGESIQVNEGSVIQKIDGLNGVEYVDKKSNRRDYYVFIDIDDAHGLVINSDNHTDMGYFLFQVALSEFYFEVNTKANLLDFYDGPGEETDFPDIMEHDDISRLYDEYHDATDEELMSTKEYQQVSSCTHKYLQLEKATAGKLGLAIMRLAFLSYHDAHMLQAQN